MHPTRILGLFLASSSLARATWLPADRIPQNLARAVKARADDDSKASSTADNILSDIINTSKVLTDKPTPTPTSEKTSDKPETTDDPTTEKKLTTTHKPTSEPTQTKDDPTTDDDKGTPTTDSTPTQTGSGDNNNNDGDNQTDPSDSQITPAPSSGGSGDSGNNGGNDDGDSSTPSIVISTKTTVLTTTNAAGEEVAVTSTSTTTTTPGLSNEDSGDASKGMPDSTRNTVIGVVVGVGGAIILGALGFVFWRIRARKRNAEESDGLMSYDPAVHNMEKGDAASGSIGTAGRNPFQSTLENYHRPTQVNPSANF